MIPTIGSVLATLAPMAVLLTVAAPMSGWLSLAPAGAGCVTG